MRTRIVPAIEIKPTSLLAKDYVGGPVEPDTSAEEAYLEQMDEGMKREMRAIDVGVKELLEQTPYTWEASDITECCKAPVFESDDQEDGTHPQCSKCGEPYPTLLNPEPQEELE